MLRASPLSNRRLSSPRILSTARRTYATNGNAGRKGPLTGAEKKKDTNAGRAGPLTGKPKGSPSSKKTNQSEQAEASSSTQGAEASPPPKTVPGQGIEDKGGHAVPSGPGNDGKFVEQGDSALKVAGSVGGQGNEREEGRDQRVDKKFWSDKK